LSEEVTEVEECAKIIVLSLRKVVIFDETQDTGRGHGILVKELDYISDLRKRRKIRRQYRAFSKE
jgi:hypothetical protein